MEINDHYECCTHKPNSRGFELVRMSNHGFELTAHVRFFSEAATVKLPPVRVEDTLH